MFKKIFSLSLPVSISLGMLSGGLSLPVHALSPAAAESKSVPDAVKALKSRLDVVGDAATDGASDVENDKDNDAETNVERNTQRDPRGAKLKKKGGSSTDRYKSAITEEDEDTKTETAKDTRIDKTSNAYIFAQAQPFPDLDDSNGHFQIPLPLPQSDFTKASERSEISKIDAIYEVSKIKAQNRAIKNALNALNQLDAVILEIAKQDIIRGVSHKGAEKDGADKRSVYMSSSMLDNNDQSSKVESSAVVADNADDADDGDTGDNAMPKTNTKTESVLMLTDDTDNAKVKDKLEAKPDSKTSVIEDKFKTEKDESVANKLVADSSVKKAAANAKDVNADAYEGTDDDKDDIDYDNSDEGVGTEDNTDDEQVDYDNSNEDQDDGESNNDKNKNNRKEVSSYEEDEEGQDPKSKLRKQIMKESETPDDEDELAYI